MGNSLVERGLIHADMFFLNFIPVLLSFNEANFFFVFVFSRWLDKLGLAARLKHEVVVRQTFFGGNYALLDKNLDPNPVCSSCEDDIAGLKKNLFGYFPQQSF